ncbi:MAG: ANTAR domain-containing protein [Desulfuromonadales bacterium]|nr:ANTAR domain-containing protein [Desulfuromonadales bacterium]
MKKAMVSENDPLLRRQIAGIVEECGFDEILETDNGRRAVELAGRQEILLVVMDADNPAMDGITAAERIGRVRPVPIVLLTSSVASETLERARLAGIMNCVAKPICPDQLRIAIDLAIHQFVELAGLRDEVTRLKETLETRKLVERAKGVLMKKGMDEPAAFRRLQKLAMDKRRSLREIAEAVLLMEE